MFNKIRETWNNLTGHPKPPVELTEAETAALFAAVGVAVTIGNYLVEHGPALKSMAQTMLGLEIQPVETHKTRSVKDENVGPLTPGSDGPDGAAA